MKVVSLALDCERRDITQRIGRVNYFFASCLCSVGEGVSSGGDCCDTAITMATKITSAKRRNALIPTHSKNTSRMASRIIIKCHSHPLRICPPSKMG